MRQEHFFHTGSKEIVRDLDVAARRAGVSRGRSFEDWLTCTVCALSGQQMEEEYLETVHRGYEKGEQGKRGIDSLAEALGRLVAEMEKTRDDILGDVFQGAITYGEAGQFFTLCQAWHKVNHAEFRIMRSCRPLAPDFRRWGRPDSA